MHKLHLFLFVIAVVLSLLNFAKSIENDTCEISKSLAKSTPPNHKVRVHCVADKSCAGFHCLGVYLLDNAFQHTKKGDPVCFGAIINRCDSPLSMDVYLQHVLMNSTVYQNRLHHNTTIHLPGTTLKFDQFQTDLFLFVEMVHEDNKVTFALTAKIRVTIGKIVNWPDHLNFKVVPELTFVVPPCPPGESKNVTTNPVFPPCVLTPVVTISAVKPMSKTYGKRCDPTKVYQCGKKEMCTFNQTCDCSSGMVLNPLSGYCDTPGASPKPRPNPVATTTMKSASVGSTGSSAHQTAANTSKKMSTGLVTGLAVGAVAVLGIVILVSFFIWRSRSSQFNHVPIIENEEMLI